MCTADKKIDRLEVGMSKMNARVSVIETKLDGVIEALERIQTDRTKDINRIIETLEAAKKDASEETEENLKGIKAKKWAVVMAVLSAVLGFTTTLLGALLLKLI